MCFRSFGITLLFIVAKTKEDHNILVVLDLGVLLQGTSSSGKLDGMVVVHLE